jgi:hypothetical protein
MPVAAFFGNGLLATDLEALHGSPRDASGLDELNDGQICQGTCSACPKSDREPATPRRGRAIAPG